jgi:hypothetical protein
MDEDLKWKCIGWVSLFISSVALIKIKAYSKEIDKLIKQKDTIKQQRHPYLPGKIPIEARGKLVMISGLCFNKGQLWGHAINNPDNKPAKSWKYNGTIYF